MTTFQHYLLDKQLEAVERWQAEHDLAMRAHDLDDVLRLLADAWHGACLRVNDLPPDQQAGFEAGLVEPGILARLDRLIQNCVELAERTGYHDRGFSFSRDRLRGLRKSVAAALARRHLPRRAAGAVALEELPPLQPLHPEDD